MTSALTLRPYQQEAITAVERALERGVRRPMIVLPTVLPADPRPPRALAADPRSDCNPGPLRRQAAGRGVSVAAGSTR